MVGVPKSDRVRDVLDVRYGAAHKAGRPGASAQEIASGLCANVSQCVTRNVRIGNTPIGTLTRNAVLYSYVHDCILSGVDHMKLMGWPDDMCPGETFSDHELRIFAGDQFSLPVAALIMHVAWCNPFGPWWGKDHAP